MYGKLQRRSENLPCLPAISAVSAIVRPVERCNCQWSCTFPPCLLPAACLLTSPCRWALACQLGSWFNAYCLVRTYSNSLEAVATIWASHLWQASWAADHPARPRARALRCTALAVAAAGVIIRPSSALTWVPLGEKVAEHAILVQITLTISTEVRSAEASCCQSMPHNTLWCAGIWELLRSKGMARAFLLQETLPIGAAALASGCLLDRIGYGRQASLML